MREASTLPSFANSTGPLELRGVHLWCVRPDGVRGDRLLRLYEAMLSPDERGRYVRLKFAPNRHEFLITRALVRTVLARYLGVEPPSLRFEHGPFGRPEITPRHDVRFNLSNSGGLVVCLVSESREVGVDVEPLARASAILELAAEVFSPHELAALRALPREAQFSRALSLWTLKESYIKARGMGLAIPLKLFSFVFPETGPPRVEIDPSLGDRASRWRCGSIDRFGHRISWTVEHRGPSALGVQVFDTVPLVSYSSRSAGDADASGLVLRRALNGRG